LTAEADDEARASPGLMVDGKPSIPCGVPASISLAGGDSSAGDNDASASLGNFRTPHNHREIRECMLALF